MSLTELTETSADCLLRNTKTKPSSLPHTRRSNAHGASSHRNKFLCRAPSLCPNTSIAWCPSTDSTFARGSNGWSVSTTVARGGTSNRSVEFSQNRTNAAVQSKSEAGILSYGQHANMLILRRQRLPCSHLSLMCWTCWSDDGALRKVRWSAHLLQIIGTWASESRSSQSEQFLRYFSLNQKFVSRSRICPLRTMKIGAALISQSIGSYFVIYQTFSVIFGHFWLFC